MKKPYLIYTVIILVACNSKNKLLKYQDSSNKYFVQVQPSQNTYSKDSLLTFYDINNSTDVKEVGFIKDGFRNGMWGYNFAAGTKKITWGHYKNKNLGFETNLFERADSVKYGDSFVRFLFSTDAGNVILNVFINGALKDSTPEVNYKRITEREFLNLGIETVSFKTYKINYKPNEIYISEIEAKDISSNQLKFLKTGFSFVDQNTFVEFSVISSKENAYRDILFNAVFTNFFINGERLYDPFRKDWISNMSIP